MVSARTLAGSYTLGTSLCKCSWDPDEGFEGMGEENHGVVTGEGDDRVVKSRVLPYIDSGVAWRRH